LNVPREFAEHWLEELNPMAIRLQEALQALTPHQQVSEHADLSNFNWY
jgi:hypothetical protein